MFVLEQESERQARAEAEERLKRAQARFENLQVPLRQPQIAALREQLNQARAALALSRANYTREQELFNKGFSPKARLDDARSAQERDAARVKEAEAQIKNAELPLGRQGGLESGQAQMAAANAALAQADWKGERESGSSPGAGMAADAFLLG